MARRILIVLMMSVSWVRAAFAQSSATFAMKRLSIIAGSAIMTSAHFSTDMVGPQESPVGGASFCNVGSRTGLGFWSVLGRISVPIVLTARRSTVDPLDIDLSWSGAEPAFQVYRAFTPADVLNPGNLDRETSVCSATDTLASQSDLMFYNVIPKP